VSHIPYLSQFDQINDLEIENIAVSLNSKYKSYSKGDVIISQDDPIKGIGIILLGNVDIIKEDYFGKRSILANLKAPDFFGEVFVCAGITKSPVSVIANEETEIMLIDYNRIISSCSNSCSHHTQLIKNMLKLIANKNLVLNRKIDYLLIKSLRQKIATYLLDRFTVLGTKDFQIPFARAELADYLNVDRSALSRELSRMMSEGLISYNKKNFQLIELEALEEILIN